MVVAIATQILNQPACFKSLWVEVIAYYPDPFPSFEKGGYPRLVCIYIYGLAHSLPPFFSVPGALHSLPPLYWKMVWFSYVMCLAMWKGYI